MHDDYRPGMTLTRFATLTALALSAATAIPVTAQSFAQHHDDQKNAREQLLDGQVMPFSIIKRKVEKEMGDASYVGVANSPRKGVYRMQFLRKDGQVIWVDVDGKTGEIIARTK